MRGKLGALLCLSLLSCLSHHRVTGKFITSFGVSNDGETIFYVSTSEGHQDLYGLSLTSGASVPHIGAHPWRFCIYEGRIIVRSNHESPFDCLYIFWEPDNLWRKFGHRPANFIAYDQDYSTWATWLWLCVVKRYRGTAGEIWCAKERVWMSVSHLKSNLLRLIPVGGRLYFLSDLRV